VGVVVVVVAVVDVVVAVAADEPGNSNLYFPYMKTYLRSFTLALLKRCFPSSIHRNWVLPLVLSAPFMLSAAESGRTFATPEEAVSALAAAASAKDTNALRVLFGSAAADLQNPDRVQATNDLIEFTTAFNQAQRIVRQSDSKYVLQIGENSWPFPIPIVKKDGQWFFDAEAGKDELLNRRIGDNELATLEAVRAYVEAQREYAMKDRDGDEVLEYAQKFASAPGKKDGLYWPEDLDGEVSPLGPLIADAQAEGYKPGTGADAGEPQPFHGYFFKILTRQGKFAPGGKYNYIINGNMIGGFALVAWPADYEGTGVMTFIVNQQGRVYQKDLGPKTVKIAPAMKEYNPDKTWTLSRD
jgi:hypothetical protein